MLTAPTASTPSSRQGPGKPPAAEPAPSGPQPSASGQKRRKAVQPRRLAVVEGSVHSRGLSVKSERGEMGLAEEVRSRPPSPLSVSAGALGGIRGFHYTPDGSLSKRPPSVSLLGAGLPKGTGQSSQCASESSMEMWRKLEPELQSPDDLLSFRHRSSPVHVDSSPVRMELCTETAQAAAGQRMDSSPAGVELPAETVPVAAGQHGLFFCPGEVEIAASGPGGDWAACGLFSGGVEVPARRRSRWRWAACGLFSGGGGGACGDGPGGGFQGSMWTLLRWGW
ncbi:hypothetical protein CYMTET_34611, partial [Cymbomonas tetramitiformis]